MKLIVDLLANLAANYPALITIGIAGGLSYAGGQRYFARQKERRDHDIKNYARFEEVLTEIQFHNIIEQLFIERLTSERSGRIDSVLAWAALASNSFALRKLQRNFEKFIRCLNILDEFIAAEFYSMDRTPEILALGPRPITSPEAAAHVDKVRPQLGRLLENARTCYREFRSTVKVELLQ